MGWLSRWVNVHPEEGPRSGLICPYDIALNELQLGWGRPNVVLSNRQAEQERQGFCTVSHAMRDLGLIRYRRDAAVAPAGDLYADQDVWACRNSALHEGPDSPLPTWLNYVDVAAHSLSRG